MLINFNNKFCPRDTKDQIKYFKKKIKLYNIKKNDLIFWKGHVAIVLSKNKLIHAYGPLKKVVIMPIKKTIDVKRGRVISWYLYFFNLLDNINMSI